MFSSKLKYSCLLACLLLLVAAPSVSAQKPLKLKELTGKKLGGDLLPSKHKKKDLWGFSNDEGKVIIKQVFDDCRQFVILSIDGSDTLRVARVKYEGKWGLLRRNSTFLVEPQYDSLEAYNGNFAHFHSGGYQGFLGPDGSVVLDQIQDIQPIKGQRTSLQWVMIGDRWGAMDAQKQIVYPCTLKSIPQPLPNAGRDNLMITSDSGVGVMRFSTFKTVVPAKYSSVECRIESGRTYYMAYSSAGKVLYSAAGDPLIGGGAFEDISFAPNGDKMYYLGKVAGRAILFAEDGSAVMGNLSFDDVKMVHHNTELLFECRNDNKLYLFDEQGRQVINRSFESIEYLTHSGNTYFIGNAAGKQYLYDRTGAAILEKNGADQIVPDSFSGSELLFARQAARYEIYTFKGPNRKLTTTLFSEIPKYTVRSAGFSSIDYWDGRTPTMIFSDGSKYTFQQYCDHLGYAEATSSVIPSPFVCPEVADSTILGNKGGDYCFKPDLTDVIPSAYTSTSFIGGFSLYVNRSQIIDDYRLNGVSSVNGSAALGSFAVGTPNAEYRMGTWLMSRLKSIDFQRISQFDRSNDTDYASSWHHVCFDVQLFTHPKGVLACCTMSLQTDFGIAEVQYSFTVISVEGKSLMQVKVDGPLYTRPPYRIKGLSVCADGSLLISEEDGTKFYSAKGTQLFKKSDFIITDMSFMYGDIMCALVRSKGVASLMVVNTRNYSSSIVPLPDYLASSDPDDIFQVGGVLYFAKNETILSMFRMQAGGQFVPVIDACKVSWAGKSFYGLTFNSKSGALPWAFIGLMPRGKTFELGDAMFDTDISIGNNCAVTFSQPDTTGLVTYSFRSLENKQSRRTYGFIDTVNGWVMQPLLSADEAKKLTPGILDQYKAATMYLPDGGSHGATIPYHAGGTAIPVNLFSTPLTQMETVETISNIH